MLNSVYSSFLKYAGIGGKAKGKPTPPELDAGIPSDMARVEEYSAAMCDLKAGDIKLALASADSGEPRDQAAIAASILDSRDGVVGAQWRTRRNAVLGKDWDVVPVDGKDDAAKETAMLLRKELDASGVKGLIGSLVDRGYFGYAGSLIEWDQKAASPSRFVPIHASRISFDLSGNPAVTLGWNGIATPVADLPFGRCVMNMEHTASSPAKSGMCRSLLWMWLFKRDAWLHRVQYIERYGSPILKAKIPQSQWEDKSKVASLVSRLKDSGRRGVAVHPDGTDLEIVAAMGNASNADFSKFISEIDDVITLVILGQLATSGESSGMSKGQAQENVRLDILASDCQGVMDAVKRQVLAPMCVFKGLDPDSFEFKILYEPAADTSAIAQTVKTLYDAGLEVDQEWAAETFSMPLTRKAAPAPSPFPPVEGSLPMSDSPMEASAVAQEELVSRVTEAALERMFTSKTAVSEFYMPLRREIKAVFSDMDVNDPELIQAFVARADKLFSRYPAIYEAMVASSEGYQKIFGDAVRTAVAGTRK